MTCPRCQRKVNPWPLMRRDLCSPKHWAVCIRQEEDVIADYRRRGYEVTFALADNGDGGK